jgi:hypothetical protein
MRQWLGLLVAPTVSEWIADAMGVFYYKMVYY